ncbi:MAG TPA: tRNA cyclic N6-threonylcarbamoyladenosine(37) synthase TcdA, partial [Herbaspirillum sp.]|nr:tRNA cyclic N6-threonylcarbamoyladenosine(37) synthase TcdA [Herbaspirillum sp.]
KVRKRLRARYQFPRGIKNRFGIDAVFSTEPLRVPEGEACEVNTVDGRRQAGVTGLHCAGLGSVMVVTAAFGLVAAGFVLRKIVERPHRVV